MLPLNFAKIEIFCTIAGPHYFRETNAIIRLKYAFKFELALLHEKAFFSLLIFLIITIWQVIKKGKIRVNEFDSALHFPVVKTTSIQMIGSTPGSHGCAFQWGPVNLGWSSDSVHRHACH